MGPKTYYYCISISESEFVNFSSLFSCLCVPEILLLKICSIVFVYGKFGIHVSLGCGFWYERCCCIMLGCSTVDDSVLFECVLVELELVEMDCELIGFECDVWVVNGLFRYDLSVGCL